MTLLLVFIGIFLVLSALRVPVAISMAIGAVVGFSIGNLHMMGIPAAFFSGLDSFPLLAIPAFIFAGDIMGQGGISKALVNMFMALFGRLRGSLGTVMIATAMFFGTITGSAVATVSAVGGIMVPEMLKRNYERKYVTALLAATSFAGFLIPPSVPGILYSLGTGLRITDVWISTLPGGLLLGALYMVLNFVVYGRHQPKITEPFVLSDYTKGVITVMPKATVAIIMPVIIFGGVYGGVFTPTEAGAVSVVYGLVAGWIVYPILFRSRPDANLYKMTMKSAITCATLALIIAAATLVGRMVAMGGVVRATSDFLLSVTDSQIIFLLLVNLIFLFIGMLLDINVSVIIFAPIFAPIALEFGVEPIHFAAIMLTNLSIGLITPGFAASIFVACRITNLNYSDVIKPMLPFYICCLVVLAVVTYVPQFSLFLVEVLR
ncbi:MAG: TRAP transporter large permease [Defluviitaleaceae bacterium]|nr:TRAP transporter large permease [Defluviitaleaceae bacterium]